METWPILNSPVQPVRKTCRLLYLKMRKWSSLAWGGSLFAVSGVHFWNVRCWLNMESKTGYSHRTRWFSYHVGAPQEMKGGLEAISLDRCSRIIFLFVSDSQSSALQTTILSWFCLIRSPLRSQVHLANTWGSLLEERTDASQRPSLKVGNPRGAKSFVSTQITVLH